MYCRHQTLNYADQNLKHWDLPQNWTFFSDSLDIFDINWHLIHKHVAGWWVHVPAYLVGPEGKLDSSTCSSTGEWEVFSDGSGDENSSSDKTSSPPDHFELADEVFRDTKMSSMHSGNRGYMSGLIFIWSGADVLRFRLILCNSVFIFGNVPLVFLIFFCIFVATKR